jgi:tellurite resistance protein TehA-like permease
MILAEVGGSLLSGTGASPLEYDPLYWGAVFPLGMYASSTHEMAAALGFHFLDFIPVSFFYLALAA